MTLEARAARALAMLVIGLVLIGFLVWAGFAWKSRRDRAAAADATIEAQAGKIEATTGIATDAAEATTASQVVEHRISVDTAQLARELERARHAKPELDRFVSQPWPGELRELARARRIARERSGGAAPGSGSADPGAPADRPGDPR